MDKKIPLAGLKKAVEGEIALLIKREVSEEKFFRIEIRTELIDPLFWLQVQPGREKIYFQARGRGEPEVAGSGSALRVVPEKNETLNSYYNKVNIDLTDEQKLYGGISFYKTSPSGNEWESFGAFNFMLPRFEYLKRERRGYFSVNFCKDELNREKTALIIKELNNLVFEVPRKHEKGAGNEFVAYSPDKKLWISGISSYLKQIKKGEIRKIVPARRLELKNSGKADPFCVMHELRRSGDYTANFLMTFNGENYFAGATPERLFRRDGELLTTESVAGTISRGKDNAEDEINEHSLLNSGKETLEHDFVTNDVVNKIDPICELVAISERVVLKLANLQHLYRRISGKLKKDISDGEILDKMFPTPAVSGLPLDKCLKLLKKDEPFDRGWYAGVVGFAGKTVSDYYVGIRSVLMNSDKIYIYSGAGIVEGSDPENEWEEIDLKIKKYKRILKYEI